MKLYNTLVLAIVLGTTSADECGPAGAVSMAGSSTVFPLANAWYGDFSSQCPGTTFTIEGGGSSAGAGRVCGNPSRGSPVEIGNMSREWKSSEASLAANGWQYDCNNSDRSAAQFPVAGDGITVVMAAGGPGATCMSSLSGLSVDQLRWIFSSYKESELVADGWDASSISSDGNDNTHLWSELSSSCPGAPIEIAGPDSASGTYEFFKETILTGANEDFRTGYFNSADDEKIVEHISEDGTVVGYFGYAAYNAHIDDFYAAPIENGAGVYVAPSPETVLDGSYNPLSRNIYMNFLIDGAALEKTMHYLEFGYSDAGDALTSGVGYVALSANAKAEMEMQRISTLLHDNVWTDADKDAYWCEVAADITSAGSSTVAPIMTKWADAYGGAQGECPESSISVEGGGSSTGAKRVCGALDKVMIGNMSRDWKDSEVTRDGSKVSCKIGDTSVTATQLPVALDGITVATAKGSAAEECIGILGGLNVMFLNFIFSDSLGGLEFMWSDLSADCAAVPIKVTGPDDSHGTNEFFGEVVLNSGESFSPFYHEAEVEERVQYLKDNSGAIGYFGYVAYESNIDVLSAVPIENDSGAYVIPSTASIADGSYNPMSRLIYINVDNASMGKAYSFLKFAFSGKGSEIVQDVGYVPVSLSSKLWQATWADVVSEL